MRDYWVVIRGNLSPWTTTTISPLTLEEAKRAKDLRLSDQVEDHCAVIVATSKDRAKKDTDFYSGLYALEQKAHAAHISNLKRALVTPEEFDPKLASASAIVKQCVVKEMENHLAAEKKRHP